MDLRRVLEAATHRPRGRGGIVQVQPPSKKGSKYDMVDCKIADVVPWS